MIIAVDAMGGDKAPISEIEGAITATESLDVTVALVGPESVLKRALSKYKYNPEKILIENAPEVVKMREAPSLAIRKRSSSISICGDMVSEGKAQGMVSAGNTGAVMATLLVKWRTIKGVARPAIGSLLPTTSGVVLLIDVGANVDCKPNYLLQFAQMGKVYSQHIIGIENPKIGLLSIGEEESKGNELTGEAFELLKNSKLNFFGNVEGKDILTGIVDVIVCDGFVGNVVLKFGESIGAVLIKWLRMEFEKGIFTRLAGAFMKRGFMKIKKKIDYAETGGAPLLGINGVCIISHGKSTSKAIMNAIRVATEFVNHKVNEHISEEITNNHTTL